MDYGVGFESEDSYSLHMRGNKWRSNLRLRWKRLLACPPGRAKTLGYRYCLPEPQSLLRVEVEILPCSELCADINIFGGGDNSMSFFVRSGTRFHMCIGRRRSLRSRGGALVVRDASYKSCTVLYTAACPNDIPFLEREMDGNLLFTCIVVCEQR